MSVSSGGEGLDAVRRPLRVLADARTARERRLELVDGSRAVTITVPREASARGPGQLTLAVGARLFGEPAEQGEPLWAGWALAVAGEPLSDQIAEAVMQWVSYEDEDGDYLREPLPRRAGARRRLGRSAADRRGRGARAPRGRAAPALARGAARSPDAIGDAQADWLLLALAHHRAARSARRAARRRRAPRHAPRARRLDDLRARHRRALDLGARRRGARRLGARPRARDGDAAPPRAPRGARRAHGLGRAERARSTATTATRARSRPRSPRSR
ncbi:MAG: hypothetical protein M5U28_19980 [Sandaracinaceae bacterium]|nr:hypothetical protein [Sandaracinaceae bacterium]